MVERIMSPEESRKLSASLEDYLEAIFNNLAAGTQGARSKDIAQTLGVARSSVTGAVQLLREKGLVNYEPYGRITLTPRGSAAAREVARKHDVLTSFFVDVLGVEAEAAQQAACRTEHALGQEIITRLLRFVDYVAISGKTGRDVAGEFRRFYEKQAVDEIVRADNAAIGKTVVDPSETRSLSAVKTGDKARLIRIDAGRRLNSRLAALGFVPDAELTVVSNGHPGPFVVVVKDVKMALGRGVAHKILVR
jgi:DtxR family Mn-dependent transcriptional regulator